MHFSSISPVRTVRRRVLGILLTVLSTLSVAFVPASRGDTASAATACEPVLFVGARGSGQTYYSSPGVVGHSDPTKSNYDGGTGMGPQVYAYYQAFSNGLVRPVQIDALPQYQSVSVPLSVRPSTWDHFFESIDGGKSAIINSLVTGNSSCPNQQLVLAGYSQGAMALRGALLSLARQGRSDILNRVRGVELIGDGYRTSTDHITSGNPATGDGGEGVATYFGVYPNPRGNVPKAALPNAIVGNACTYGDLVCDFTADVGLYYQAGIHTDSYTNRCPGSGLFNCGSNATGMEAANTRKRVQLVPFARYSDVPVSAPSGSSLEVYLDGTFLPDTNPDVRNRYSVKAGSALPPGLSLSASGDTARGIVPAVGTYQTTFVLHSGSGTIDETIHWSFTPSWTAVASFKWSRLSGEHSAVVVDASGSYGGKGSITDYAWTTTPGGVSATGRTATLRFATAATETVTLTITTSAGVKKQVSHVVSFANRLPVVTAMSPTNGSTLSTTTPVLNATATDADGDPVAISYTVSGPQVSLASGYISGPWVIPSHQLDPGTTYTWTAQARDSYGGTSGVAKSKFTVAHLPVAADVIATPDGLGYWQVDSHGKVTNFGDAVFLGDLPSIGVDVTNVIGMSRTPSGLGYWLVASDGGVFAFGDAPFLGSRGGSHLNQPVVGMVPTRLGKGYWLVAADGGVFSFGDAQFLGNMVDKPLNGPVIAMGATSDDGGYWLAASDGGVFAFGNAQFYGSMGDKALNYPVVDMSVTPSGHGYWLVAQDGGVFTFGDATFFGSLVNRSLPGHIVSIERTPDGGGYWLNGCDGSVYPFGDAADFGSGSIYQCRGIYYNRLQGGRTLSAGDDFLSPDGRYQGIMQPDGNFVIYGPGHVATFASGTDRHPGARLVMQSDGNLVVYQGGTPLWASQTSGRPGAHAELLDTGHLIVYVNSQLLCDSNGTPRCG